MSFAVNNGIKMAKNGNIQNMEFSPNVLRKPSEVQTKVEAKEIGNENEKERSREIVNLFLETDFPSLFNLSFQPKLIIVGKIIYRPNMIAQTGKDVGLNKEKSFSDSEVAGNE